VHLVIASLAAIGWMMAPPDSALSMFLLVLLLTAGAGFLLRLSIFARTDGYVILSYLLDRNDLQEWAVAEVRAWLTLSVSPQPCTDRERFWLRAYGLGILALRRIVVPLFLGFAGWLLIARLDGTGALIGIVMILWWFQDSIRRFFMDQNWFRRLIAACSRWWMRWTIRLLLLAGIVAAGFIPYNYEIGGDCRLVPMSQYGVRAQISDEIVEVHVAEGDLVNPGDPLVTLAVREERAAVATTRADLQRAIAQLELLEAGPLEEEVRMAEESVERWRAQDAYWAAELKRVEELQGTVASPQMLDRTRTSKEETARSLQASIEYLTRIKRGARDEEIRAAQAEVQRLTALLAHHEEMLALGTITAPVAGRVITSNVQERVGQTVQPGDLIAVLHDTSSLLGEVAASESAALQIKEGMPVKARLRGIDGRLLMGTVHHLSGNAVEDTQFDVEPIRSDREAQFQQVRGHEHDRRVRVYVALDHYDEDLVAGMTGYARIVVSRDVLWRALMRPVLRFFRVEVWSWFP
jgi:multidrug resistance efflux pump